MKRISVGPWVAGLALGAGGRGYTVSGDQEQRCRASRRRLFERGEPYAHLGKGLAAREWPYARCHDAISTGFHSMTTRAALPSS